MNLVYRFGIVVLPLLLGCPANETKSDKPDFKNAIQHQIRYDKSRKAIVAEVAIKPGFHAYSVGETTGRPLRLRLAKDSAFVLDGEVSYPKGIEKNLSIGRSVIVVGKAEAVARIKKAPDKEGKAKGDFRYQVCTDDACDRPRTKKFELVID